MVIGLKNGLFLQNIDSSSRENTVTINWWLFSFYFDLKVFELPINSSNRQLKNVRGQNCILIFKNKRKPTAAMRNGVTNRGCEVRAHTTYIHTIYTVLTVLLYTTVL